MKSGFKFFCAPIEVVQFFSNLLTRRKTRENSHKSLLTRRNTREKLNTGRMHQMFTYRAHRMFGLTHRTFIFTHWMFIFMHRTFMSILCALVGGLKVKLPYIQLCEVNQMQLTCRAHWTFVFTLRMHCLREGQTE
jgi:hypothetical protein